MGVVRTGHQTVGLGGSSETFRSCRRGGGCAPSSFTYLALARASLIPPACSGTSGLEYHLGEAAGALGCSSRQEQATTYGLALPAALGAFAGRPPGLPKDRATTQLVDAAAAIFPLSKALISERLDGVGRSGAEDPEAVRRASGDASPDDYKCPYRIREGQR